MKNNLCNLIVSEVNGLDSDYKRINEHLIVIAGLDTAGYTESKNLSFDTIAAATHKLCRKDFPLPLA